jgi:lipoprotein NlpD
MRRSLASLAFLVLIAINIAGCIRQHKFHPAPVVNGWDLPAARHNAYIVQKGDTLYSIAWAFGMDYRDLANINNLHPPYTLLRHQKIFLHKPAGKHVSKQHVSKWYVSKQPVNKHPVIANETYVGTKNAAWNWPAKGRVVSTFNNSLGGNKGIDIAGNYGEEVKASAAGRVVYCGAGIPIYGNLIIIKHSDDYLSAYAYNKTIVVHQGQVVAAKQTIGTMGRDNADVTKLHFEIRHNGKPVNPGYFLTAKHD